jgi:hypothetical protein
MGIFMPPDIGRRITLFIAGKQEFPFVRKEELLATFYLFGKDYGVIGPAEAKAAADLARKTVEQAARDIRLYQDAPAKMDANLARENYTKRSLQIVVDNPADHEEINSRVAGDPAILSDCFVKHIAYYQQEYFFELFQPFKPTELPESLRSKLKGRMLLLGFNVKDRNSLPFNSSLDPFFQWMLKQHRNRT